MDAPKGRYRVEEKDGRLVVIDTATGAPASSVSPSPRPSGSPLAPPAPRSPLAVAPRPGPVDRLGQALLPFLVSHWDAEGRAVVAWKWQENGKPRRWDAALDEGQQRRLVRGLFAFAAFPLFVLLLIFGGGAALMLLPLAAASTFWGIWSLVRLMRETGGPTDA